MSAVKVAFPTANLRDNCQGMWNLKGNGNDVSPNSNDMTAYGGPSFVTDQPYTSEEGVDLELSSSQYLEIVNGSWANLSPTSDVSMGAWFKLESLPATSKVILTADNGGPFEFAVRGSGDNNIIRFSIIYSSSPFHTTTSFQCESGIWYFVMCVFEASVGSKIYFNGSLETNNTTSPPAGIDSHTNDIRIGARTNGSDYFDGIISEVMFFDTVVTPEEVQALFSMGAYKMYSGIEGQYLPRLSLDFIGAA